MFIAGQELQLEADKRRFKSHIRGWRKGSYILIDLDYTGEIGSSLKIGQEIVARFFMGGSPYGFVTSPIQFLYNHNVAMLKYPERIEQNSERRHERFPVSTPVEILQVMAGHELEEWRGVVRDISLSGVNLISPRPVAVNDMVFLAFPLATGAELDNAQATVNRVAKVKEGYEIGLEFVFLSNENKEALTGFVDMAVTRGWTLL